MSGADNEIAEFRSANPADTNIQTRLPKPSAGNPSDWHNAWLCFLLVRKNELKSATLTSRYVLRPFPPERHDDPIK